MKSVLSWVLGCSLLLTLVAYAVGAPPSIGGGPVPEGDIPLAELGQRADQQQAPPLPVIERGQALLEAPMQALRGRVGPEGLCIESTSAHEGQGEFRMVPSWLAAGGPAATLPPGTVTLSDRAVVLDRGAVEEVYTTVSDGLRQNIIIKTRPAGSGDLTLTLVVEGATAHQTGSGATLTLPGRRKLLYHGLKATDADGKALETVLSQSDPQTLVITVREADVLYPITLAATITDEDWFALGSGMSGYVMDLALAPDGTLYAGGNFTQAGGVAANYIAKWNGNAWSALGSGTNSHRLALAVVSDGTLYAGGDFTQAGGVAANYIAKWNGSAWSALGSGLDNAATALAIAPDGSLYAGGIFSQAGGVAAKYIAKWNGSAWSALGGGTRDYVNDLAVAPDGSLYAAFYQGGGEANRIAKWDGSAWTALKSGVDGLGWISSLAVAPDGTLYAGGGFNQVGGVAAKMIARWDGSAWSALGSGLLGGPVYTLALESDGTLYAGGNFDWAGGVTSNMIAGVHLVTIPQAPLVLMAKPNIVKVNESSTLSTTGGSGTGVVIFQLTSGPCSLTDNVLKGTGRGSCIVTAKKRADPNYSATTSSPVTVTVNLLSQAALVLRAKPAIIEVNWTSTLNTTGGSGSGAVTYALTSGPCSLSGNVLKGTGGGACVVTATKAQDNVYEAITSEPVTVTVKKVQLPLVLSANPTTIPVNGVSALSTTGGSGSGAVSYQSSGPCTVVGSTLIGYAYGSCVVTATKAADADYGAVTSAPVTVNVKLSQATLVLSANPTSIKVNETSTLSNTGGSGSGAVTYALTSGPCSLSGNVLKGMNSGNCVVTATKAADAVYDVITSAPVTVTVDELPQAAIRPRGSWRYALPLP